MYVRWETTTVNWRTLLCRTLGFLSGKSGALALEDWCVYLESCRKKGLDANGVCVFFGWTFSPCIFFERVLLGYLLRKSCKSENMCSQWTYV